MRSNPEILDELKSLASALRGVRASVVKHPLDQANREATWIRAEDCLKRAIQASREPRFSAGDPKQDLRNALGAVQMEMRSLSIFVGHAKGLVSAWMQRRAGMTDGYERDGRPVRASNEREIVQA